MELSFGEQIKVLLNRNHMTIQDLADRYEAATGSKMSRQNLAQRLKRDNFPEQDMHIFAALLGYRVSIQLEPTVHVTVPEYGRYPAVADAAAMARAAEPAEPPRNAVPEETTALDETLDLDETLVLEPLSPSLESALASVSGLLPEEEAPPSDPPGEPHGQEPSGLAFEIPSVFRRQNPQGDINPLTGQEYLTNTVRRHPDDPDFIQVYDRTTHSWSDVAEDYFWDFQKKKKELLGSDYQEPLLI